MMENSDKINIASNDFSEILDNNEPNENKDVILNSTCEKFEIDSTTKEIFDLIISCPAIFQSQQIGDPDLTANDKRKIAEELFFQKPDIFLTKFGEFLNIEHLDFILKKYHYIYEVEYYVKHFKSMLSNHKKNVIKRNRRYEAMKRLEAEGKYFSELEVEKREPLLYHQMVGQYLSETEKIIKNRQFQDNIVPSFSNFLLNQIEKDELDELIKVQQAEEDKIAAVESSSEEEVTNHKNQEKRWGEDWIEEKTRVKKESKLKKNKKINISKSEKKLLLKEFQSIMKTNFLNGKDSDFNYSEVDFNSEYDSVDIRNQDEEEKYFDEESNDAADCTDTGILDY